MMKKALSLLLALTLVLVLAAPATAAYSGSYSNSDTCYGVAYYLSARCASSSATASTTYADDSQQIKTIVTATLNDGTKVTVDRPWTTRYSAASVAPSLPVTQALAVFKIGGYTWEATINPA